MVGKRQNVGSKKELLWRRRAARAVPVARPPPAAIGCGNPLKDRCPMLMRRLGRTGLKVAALCLGGNTFGWTTDQQASEAVLDAYLDHGGNFIDTADV